MKTTRQEIKDLIIASKSVTTADTLLEKKYGFVTVDEKIAFLRGMFDVEITLDYSKKIQSYYSLLAAIFTKYSK